MTSRPQIGQYLYAFRFEYIDRAVRKYARRVRHLLVKGDDAPGIIEFDDAARLRIVAVEGHHGHDAARRTFAMAPLECGEIEQRKIVGMGDEKGAVGQGLGVSEYGAACTE